MKPSPSKILAALLLLLFSPSLLHAWCWIRDTGNTSVGCAPSLIKSTCCDGNLRLWPNGILPYHISTTTAPTLIPLIQSGINTWNNVEMSTFTSSYQGTSAAVIGANDGINLVAINPNFNPLLIGQGILAISTTTELGANTTNYRAVESDIEFNGVEHIWGDGTGLTIDTISVVAHEAGHNIGLNHAGVTCQSEGSEGCGPDFPDATMYWNLGTANKGSLELDDVAALIYGYPKSTFTVKVVNAIGTPIPGATVTLLDAAAPVNGTTPEEGGRVYGDVTNPLTLVGEKAPNNAIYVNQTPFNLTNALGFTNAIFPTHRNIRLRASFGGVTQTVPHTLIDGVSTLTITVATSQTDLVGPLLSITSHNSGDAVNTSPLLLKGTATDAGRGDSGIQQVTVDGTQAAGGTTTGAGTASWSASVPLTTGTNTLTVSTRDNAPTPNITTQSLLIIYDTDPPFISVRSPIPNGTAATINDVISVQFSEPMDASTLTPLTFISNDGLSGAITYDAASRSASFTPDAPLAPVTTYTFTLTTGVRDVAGNPLASPVSWSFSTQDASATAASSSSGGSGGGCFIQSVN